METGNEHYLRDRERLENHHYNVDELVKGGPSIDTRESFLSVSWGKLPTPACPRPAFGGGYSARCAQRVTIMKSSNSGQVGERLTPTIGVSSLLAPILLTGRNPQRYHSLFDTSSTKRLTKGYARDEMREVDNIREECASDEKDVTRYRICQEESNADNFNVVWDHLEPLK